MPVPRSIIALALTTFLLAGCGDFRSDPVQSPAESSETSPTGEVLSHPGSDRAMVPHNFVAPLDGSQEVPAVDTRARGLARFQLARGGDEISFQLNVANIENVLMSHIHLAPPGVNGGVVVWLYPADGPPPALIEGRFDGVLSTGTITDGDLVGSLAGMTLDDLVEEIRAGNAYVNVHTTQNMPGEIRGQIHVAGPR